LVCRPTTGQGHNPVLSGTGSEDSLTYAWGIARVAATGNSMDSVWSPVLVDLIQSRRMVVSYSIAGAARSCREEPVPAVGVSTPAMIESPGAVSQTPFIRVDLG